MPSIILGTSNNLSFNILSSSKHFYIILMCLSKVIEICMNQQSIYFTQAVYSALISVYQKGYSCQYSLIKLYEVLRKALDDGKCAELLLMDL